MIIVRIIGGLGNQLFQYAAGKALAKMHHTELKLDVTWLSKTKLREFELEKFNVNFEGASENEINELKPKTSLERIKQRFTPYSKKTFYKEPFFHFDTRFFQLSKRIYLQGYFQSEKYGQDIKSELKRELQLKDIPKEIAAFKEELENNNSIALHIRRGDYKNRKTEQVHGTLPLEYYKQAITILRDKVDNPVYYLFSDDPQFVQDNFKQEQFRIVSGTVSSNHLHDFHLMSQCKHNVIANSSFSWWAAWLNNNPDKIVIAPKNWFNKGPKDTYDLLPQSWIKI